MKFEIAFLIMHKKLANILNPFESRHIIKIYCNLS